MGIKKWGSLRPKPAAPYPLATPGKMGGVGKKFGAPTLLTDRPISFLCAQVLGGGGTSYRLLRLVLWSRCRTWNLRGVSGLLVPPVIGHVPPLFQNAPPNVPHVPPDSGTLRRTFAH